MVIEEAVSCSPVTALLIHDHCPHKGLLAEIRGPSESKAQCF